jgi:hypothetical protein
VLALGTIAVGAIFIVAPAIGAIPWESWTEWSFSLVLTWFLGFTLRRQERLVTDLDQRGQELTTLLKVSESITSNLEMRPLLDTVFDALGTVLDYSAVAALTLNDTRDTLTFAHVRAPGAHLSLELHLGRYPVADLGAAWDRLCHDEPIVIPDVRNTMILHPARRGQRPASSVGWRTATSSKTTIALSASSCGFHAAATRWSARTWRRRS